MKKTNQKTKILFIYRKMHTFIKNDLEILQKNFNVKTIIWNGKRNIPSIFINMLHSDIAFCWFASDFAGITVFLSKLLNKKSIVIVGGYDVAYEPELNYGQFSKTWHKRFLTKYALKNANLVLAVSDYTKKQALEKTKPRKLEVVYNGVDINKFKPSNITKEKIIVTIGNATEQGSKIKGLVTFAKASTNFPDHKFVIIGKTDETTVKKLKEINKNLVFTGRIPHEEVIKWLQKSKIYCQLSYIESFGLGLAEAMSCNCTPIVTNRGALKETVGDQGIYVSYNNVKETVVAIKKALNLPVSNGDKARERITDLFTLEQREKNLVNLVTSFFK